MVYLFLLFVFAGKETMNYCYLPNLMKQET